MPETATANLRAGLLPETSWLRRGAIVPKMLASLAEGIEDFALSNETRFSRAMRILPEEAALQQGRWRAKLAAERAWRDVSAYRHFLIANGMHAPVAHFEQLPVMTKGNYIQRYSISERCAGGKFLGAAVAIDESSGSSGKPFDWVRGAAERSRGQQALARALEHTVDSQPRLAINAFSMGAWATGQHIAHALELHSTVKSTGPDLHKVLHTLEFFGPRIAYFIAGYPPFLKAILDAMLARGFPLADYELHGLVGGEAISEELRRYLLRHFRTCYSGYGASDLEVGIGVETPEALKIRQFLHADKSARKQLLSDEPRLPMVFQYNPARHYLETSADGDLVATLTYSKILSPRIRYNIGDEAKLFSRAELMRRLSQLGYDTKAVPKPPLPMPYLFLYGRRDQTISIMGANIYPADVESALYAQPELAPGFSSFMLSVAEDGSWVHPRVSIEWRSTEVPSLPTGELARRVEERLGEINSDFRNARNESPHNARLELAIFPAGAGPFAGQERSIKHRYISRPV